MRYKMRSNVLNDMQQQQTIRVEHVLWKDKRFTTWVVIRGIQFVVNVSHWSPFQSWEKFLFLLQNYLTNL